MIPDIVAMADPRAKSRFSWVYAHHAAEDLVSALTDANKWDWEAPDLIGFTEEEVQVPDGIHEVSFYNKPAVIYLWTDKYQMRHGLLCLKDDGASCDTAKFHFDKKSISV